MPLATPAPPTIRIRMPKPIWIVMLCAAKNSTVCAVVTSGRGGGMVLASRKKITPNAV